MRPSQTLTPTLRSRIADLPRPDWVNRLQPRKMLALCLVAFAAVLAIRGDPVEAADELIVFARDLGPGHRLSADDLRQVQGISLVPASARPADARTLLGRALATAVSAGEIVTDLRVLGPALSDASGFGPDGRIVAIPLIDPGIATVLSQGNRIDVVSPSESQVLAVNAIVVSLPESTSKRPGDSRLVMAAMPSKDAQRVASASARNPLTLVLH